MQSCCSLWNHPQHGYSETHSGLIFFPQKGVLTSKNSRIYLNHLTFPKRYIALFWFKIDHTVEDPIACAEVTHVCAALLSFYLRPNSAVSLTDPLVFYRRLIRKFLDKVFLHFLPNFHKKWRKNLSRNLWKSCP